MEDLESYLSQKNPDGTVYLYKGVNPYSKLTTLTPENDFKELLAKRKVDKDKLYEYACEARVHKSLAEQ